MSTTFFFFNDTATTEIYTLSLHDALPICGDLDTGRVVAAGVLREDFVIVRAAREAGIGERRPVRDVANEDRKSTRLNSSHGYISYAVFCLKKKIKLKTRKQSVSSNVKLPI